MPSVPPIEPNITGKIKNYRKEFTAVTNGWEFGKNSDLLKLQSMAEKLISYSKPYEDAEAIAAALADVVIVAMSYLGEQGIDLETVIQGRMKSNLERAERAAKAAGLKMTKVENEWPSTNRAFEF